AGWWRRHAGLLEWNDRQGELVFKPGVPLDRVPEQEELAGPASRAGAVARATRPPALSDVVGQGRAVRNLDVAAQAARRLGEPLGHVLLAGAAGLGKTSLARAVAAGAGGGFHGCNAPLLKEPGALLRQLLALRDGDILFLDEVHRLPDRVAEVLYEAMEDGQLSLPIRSGVQQRMLHVRLEPITLIGATTEEELLPEPMRARFRIREQLEFYEAAELAELIRRAAGRAGLGIGDEAALMLARVSRDTPREALALFEQVRNDSVLASELRIDSAGVARTLQRLGIDEQGLRPSERAYLEVLRRAGRPLGLRTLAARLGVSRSALQRVHEPFLLRKGLVRMTPHGRVAA
ncbi:MAG: Holliday junction branch migration DNA helicase RuvB, partial [Planctomycetota bacterium]